jgi:uncharacterized protein YeaO (DUF488 family)
MIVRIKRVYAPPDSQDGYRVLVDRLWPRGISKERAHIVEWWKKYAPSTELRKWFDHDLNKWHQFKEEYFTELEAIREDIESSVIQANSRTITLVYSAKDEIHNQAVVLKAFIEARIPGGSDL